MEQFSGLEVDADVAAAVHRCASELDACLVCLSTHGRRRVAGVIGSTAREIIERRSVPVVVAGRDPLAHLAFGSGAGDIVHTSPAPALFVPTRTGEA